MATTATEDSHGTRVQVAVRIRPQNMSDMGDERVAVTRHALDHNSVSVDDERRGRSFSYDCVFTGGQEEVFDSIGRPMLDEVFKGFNVCLFAYGQTGSGKTYCMQGGAEEATLGVIPRFVRELFAGAQRRVEEQGDLTVRVSMSYLEIYMERVRDLLVARARGHEPESLEIHEDPQTHKLYVRGLSVHPVLSLERVVELMAIGNANRQTAETRMNEFSSRSHSIVQLTVSQVHESLEQRDLESTVALVDLAGSERQGKTESTGQQFEEAKKINHSLLMLGRALNSFSEGSNDYISLRESKLTRLLSESFGGNSKTWMLATVSPSAFNVTESLSTLEYAANAKLITNRAVQNKMARRLELSQWRALVSKLDSALDAERDTIEQLQKQLEQQRLEHEELVRLKALREAAVSTGKTMTALDVRIAKQMELNEEMRREIEYCEQPPSDSPVTSRARLSGCVWQCKLSLKSILEGRAESFTLPLTKVVGELSFTSSPTLNVDLFPINEYQALCEAKPTTRKGSDGVEYSEIRFQLSIVSASNIPRECCGRVFCKCSLVFNRGEAFKTQEVLGSSSPQWNCVKRFGSQTLTAQKLKVISENFFVFEVFGTP